MATTNKQMMAKPNSAKQQADWIKQLETQRAVYVRNEQAQAEKWQRKLARVDALLVELKSHQPQAQT